MTITAKNKDLLDECLRLWRLNNSYEERRVQSEFNRDDALCLLDDESWDHFTASGGCGAVICGYGQQRAYVQFMPTGTHRTYWRDPELIAAKERLPSRMTDVARCRIAEFHRTERGRTIYDQAPEGAKRFYQRGIASNEYNPELVYKLYRTMDDASWDYIVAHAETDRLKADLADIRTHMQGQPDGTNMFWWRGRHRPKNATSFTVEQMRDIAEELALAQIGHDIDCRWRTDRFAEKTLEDLRQIGLESLHNILSGDGPNRRDFFFRGLFWDLYYWDESSRMRLISAVNGLWEENW